MSEARYWVLLGLGLCAYYFLAKAADRIVERLDKIITLLDGQPRRSGVHAGERDVPGDPVRPDAPSDRIAPPKGPTNELSDG